MTPAEFKAGLVTLYGPKWRSVAHRAFGVSGSTIDRWVAPDTSRGAVPPHPTAVKLLEKLLVDAGECPACKARREANRGHAKNYRANKGKADG